MESMDTTSEALRLINWDLAAGTAAKLAGAGPKLTSAEIARVVADLRVKADASVEHVHRITRLDAAKDLRDSEVLVVDRAGWAQANIQGFEAMLDPALRRLAEVKGDKAVDSVSALGRAVTGTEMGAILAFLASKVLGQYDPFAPLLRTDIPAGGRLLLVAPNIVEIERELAVDPDDFRLWVCLHEQTHRVQFAAAPWLREHLRENIAELVASMMGGNDSASLLDRIKDAARNLTDAPEVEDAGPGDTGGLLAKIQGPAEKAILSHVTAVMSLLEGHANVVMDGIDASVVPTVRTIRQRFAGRGKSRGAIEKWFRKVLGLDAKMRQYSDGQAFVNKVVAEIGMEGFNAVWEKAENLPTEHELHHPADWVRRMSGAPAETGH